MPAGSLDPLMPDDDGYVLVLDDDIKYPSIYAGHDDREDRGDQRRAVVVVHGMDFHSPFPTTF